jgi:hypothetical protein
MTFADLQLRVAERCDLAQYDSTGASIAPTTVNVADRIKRAVNDAGRKVSNAVTTGTRRAFPWSWRRPLLTITINETGTAESCIAGDPTRYRLPPGVLGYPEGLIAWRSTDGPGSGQVRPVDIGQVLAMNSAEPMDAAPRIAAIVPFRGAPLPADSRPGLELVIAPSPNREYQLQARFKADVVPMTEPGQRPIWPSYVDDAVIEAAVAIFKAGEDGEELARARAFEALEMAMAQDRDANPGGLARVSAPIRTGEPEVYIDGVQYL